MKYLLACFSLAIGLQSNQLLAQDVSPVLSDPPASPPSQAQNESLAAPQLADPPVLAPGQPENAAGTMSVSSPDQLADWQKRLTLGPGDVLNITIYDQPDTAKQGLFIGPDGRLNYLQAQDVEAAGLTVDELRDKLEKILAKFYIAPRLIIIPTAFYSKKFYLLGNTVQKGVFPLDRPLTIVEAVAKARGFMALPQQRYTLMQSDFSRSFLVRRQPDDSFQRMEVDLEALFLNGDFSQNKALAPEDLLYFCPLDLQEVYVLGEVRGPGVTPYTSETTVFRAIMSRGGFTDRAYKSHVLVVRGSYNHPQPFVVNMSDVLAARSADFPLKARDIVYVHAKPWAKAEELLQVALTQYSYAIVVSWVGRNVGPFTKQPFVPNIK